MADSDPEDPFDEHETLDVFRDHMAGQLDGAVDQAQEEIDVAVAAIAVLTRKLRDLIPPLAVINLVSSMAVGTAVSETYGAMPGA